MSERLVISEDGAKVTAAAPKNLLSSFGSGRSSQQEREAADIQKAEDEIAMPSVSSCSIIAIGEECAGLHRIDDKAVAAAVTELSEASPPLIMGLATNNSLLSAQISASNPSRDTQNPHEDSRKVADPPNEEACGGTRVSRVSNGGSRETGDGALGNARRRLPVKGPLTCESLSGVEFVCGDIFQEAW